MRTQTSSHPISWYSASVSQKTTSHRFGKKLAAARKVKNLSQAELGKLMGVSRGMIAYYESSAKNPTIEIIENVAKALGVKISSLIDDADVRVTLPELMQAVLGASISPYHSLRPALVPERERDRDSLGDLICDLAESFDRRLTFQPSLLAKDFAAQSP